MRGGAQRPVVSSRAERLRHRSARDLRIVWRVGGREPAAHVSLVFAWIDLHKRFHTSLSSTVSAHERRAALMRPSRQRLRKAVCSTGSSAATCSPASALRVCIASSSAVDAASLGRDALCLRVQHRALPLHGEKK